MAKKLSTEFHHNQGIGLQTSPLVPKKHFSEWLRSEGRITRLRIWIGLVKFVLALGAVVGLTVYMGNRFPEALRYLPPVVVGICSLAGVAIGIDRYKNRRRDD